MLTVVTGGNRGIGKEICRQLQQQGVEVLLTARNEISGQEAAEELGVSFFPLDVTKAESIQALKRFLEEEYGSIGVLINNAGILLDESRPFLEVDGEMVRKTMDANAIGPFLLSLELYPLIRKGGQIIMVSSGAGSFCEGVGSYARLYSSSKTLMNTFTRHLAETLKSKSIRVNAVCPGWVRTDMGGSAAPRSVEQGADTIVWLAKDGAGQLTGCFFKDRKEISW
jgi:NAD(P)-dependent dehydrogenase (short-subunit alcohol dehydrogenase family)